ncbi:MAG: DUF3313 domain-containing protein [Planctomycetota bacterium]|jgi:hypothetical protein
MKKTKALMILAIGLLVLQCGCGGKELAKTGFLSDYSRLSAESDHIMRYMNETALDKYQSFIVDKVSLHMHSKSKVRKELNKGDVSNQEVKDLTNYMHSAVVKAVQGAGKKIVYNPGPGVVRIRVALTDIEKSSLVSAVPQASLVGAGIGGASMEAEMVDSQTGEQIGATIQSRDGSRLPFSNLGEWTTVKKVIDKWSEELQERLE